MIDWWMVEESGLSDILDPGLKDQSLLSCIEEISMIIAIDAFCEMR